MNDEARLAAGSGNTDASVHQLPDRIAISSARGAFDVRLNVEASSEEDAWHLARTFVRLARDIAPEGVSVRYVQLRPPRRSRGWLTTMAPLGRRAA